MNRPRQGGVSHGAPAPPGLALRAGPRPCGAARPAARPARAGRERIGLAIRPGDAHLCAANDLGPPFRPFPKLTKLLEDIGKPIGPGLSAPKRQVCKGDLYGYWKSEMVQFAKGLRLHRA
ncbi:MAG: hypothetical protein GC153_12740 [Alphaproteobacteria bacterium]|nr:hypothetical protein [Alphaproteobacteria bacterium]